MHVPLQVERKGALSDEAFPLMISSFHALVRRLLPTLHSVGMPNGSEVRKETILLPSIAAAAINTI